jgi:hypothetical protein
VLLLRMQMDTVAKQQQLAAPVTSLQHCRGQHHTSVATGRSAATPESNHRLPFRPQRLVRFNPVPCRELYASQHQEMPVQEINASWYSEAEFREIGEDIESTVKLLREGLTDPERVGFCYRGLEHKTPERGQERRLNIVLSVESVMVQQNRRKSDMCAALGNANTYCAISRRCEKDAHIVGLLDAKIVALLWRERGDELPRMPRRKCAKRQDAYS